MVANKGIGEGQADVSVVKVDGYGEAAWETTDRRGGLDWARAIFSSDGGGCVLLGSGFMLKVDGSGNKVWERPYGGSSMSKASDGGFVATGRKNTYKTDDEGNKVWDKKHYLEGVWPVFDDEWDSVAGIAGTDDHGCVLAEDVWKDLRVQKIDGDCEEVRDRIYGSRTILVDLVSSGDGGHVVAGSRHVEGGSGAYIVKVDGGRNAVWEMDHWTTGYKSTQCHCPQ